MKKRFLSALLTLCMAFFILPAASLAEESYFVAQIGETGYTGLQDAVDAVDAGQTIVLLEDINLLASVTIAGGNNFTLDLNGKILNGGSSAAIRHSGSGTLTITDSSAGGLGKATSATKRLDDGTIYLEGGTTDDTMLQITAGTVESTDNGSAIYNRNNGGVSISGASTVKNTGSGRAIYSAAAGKISISGTAAVTSGNSHSTVLLFAFALDGIALEITGGIVENTSMTGYAICSATEESIVSIPSGTSVIKSQMAMNTEPDLSRYADVCITASSNDKEGVEYTSEIGKSSLNDFTIEHFKYLKFEPAVAQINGTGYSTLQAAVNAAADWDTIVLLKDVEEYINITNSTSFTIDLNGCRLSRPYGGAILEYKGSGTLTITDNSSEGGGAVTSSYGAILSQGEGKILISGKAAIYCDNWYAIYISGGSAAAGRDVLEIAGGTVSSTTNTAVVNNSDGNVTISGGTVTGANAIDSIYYTGVTAVSSGTVTGTSSYAIRTSGNVTLTGGTVESTGSSDEVILCFNAQIIIPRGTVIIRGGSKNMNKAPDLSGYTSYQWRASGDGIFTPSDMAPYVWDAGHTYLQIMPYAAPAAYTVTLPTGTGYQVAAHGAPVSPVTSGGSFGFTVTIAGGYHKGTGFAVKANGITLTPNGSGEYTISGIAQNQIVTVEGVAQDTPAAESGHGGRTIPHADTTVYNNIGKTRATIWLSGRGLSGDDLLFTQTLTEGSNFNVLFKLADRDDIFRVYDISLKSGKKLTGCAMYLTFDLAEKYAGQAITLVHKKSDGAFEYFYAAAGANGCVTFGPLYELSPSMLVKGTLMQNPSYETVDIPKTGDSSGPVAPVLLALAAACCIGLMIYRKRYS
jgi:hypothetical protein